MAVDRIDLRNLTREEARALAVELGAEAYRGEQIFRWVHGRDVAGVEGMTDLGKALRERLAERAGIGRLTVDAAQQSRDGTRKLRLRTADGRAIESVLIPEGDAAAPDDDETAEPPRREKLTQCISSQVGCALDCTFCATAKLGFGRQLSAGEIVDQVYRARALLDGRRPTNLVYMGMGEPLHNLDAVVRSIRILTDGAGLDLSPRRITVSTAGLVPAIAKLGEADTGVGLAVSLNATTDAVRDQLMPINRKWKIADLLAAVRRYPLEKRRRVTFEYVLLADVNDARDDARRLPELLRGIPSKVNLIPWKPHPLAPYRRPSPDTIARFQEELRAGGLAVYVRRPRGDDIDAACGQLAGRAPDAPVPLRV